MSDQKMRSIQPKRYDPNKSMEMSDVAKPKDIYPKLTLSLKDFPEAKNWKVDSTYELDLEVKMIGVRKDEYSNEVTFEIRKVSAEDPNEEDEDEDDE